MTQTRRLPQNHGGALQRPGRDGNYRLWSLLHSKSSSAGLSGSVNQE